jgi:hypothetical protein
MTKVRQHLLALERMPDLKCFMDQGKDENGQWALRQSTDTGRWQQAFRKLPGDVDDQRRLWEVNLVWAVVVIHSANNKRENVE